MRLRTGPCQPLVELRTASRNGSICIARQIEVSHKRILVYARDIRSTLAAETGIDGPLGLQTRPASSLFQHVVEADLDQLSPAARQYTNSKTERTEENELSRGLTVSGDPHSLDPDALSQRSLASR